MFNDSPERVNWPNIRKEKISEKHLRDIIAKFLEKFRP